MTFRLLFVSVNDVQIVPEEIENGIENANFPETLSFTFFYLDKIFHIPTGLKMRAAPWHVCSVTQEFRGLEGMRCYTLNYCLMYVIDIIEELHERYSDIDCFVLLFPGPPTAKGGFASVDKKCVCVEYDILRMIDKLSVFIRNTKRDSRSALS